MNGPGRMRTGAAGAIVIVLGLMVLGFVAGPRATAETRPRLRVIVETDAGGDPDDEQSLVRFLLHANEWDVEGIIANRPVARDGENRNPERTGLGIVQRQLRAYGEVWPRLVRHDARYPSPDRLAAVTVPGYVHTNAGVDLLRAAVDRPDPRPVWFLNWGTDAGSAPSCLLRVLDDVRRERGAEGYARFKGRLRLASADRFGGHTFTQAPPFALWVDTFRPVVDGRRWYHRFSALTATAGGFDVGRDVLRDHGPLGALYPLNTSHPQKEGDTMSFLYLLPNGLGDPEEPGWGSWGGRYTPQDGAAGRHYFWAGGTETWNGVTHRDQGLARWAAALQNEFRARLDWCVKEPAAANHPPVVKLNGVPGDAPLRFHARPGDTLELDAAGSTDPDGDALECEWIHYREAGTGRESAILAGGDSPAGGPARAAVAGGRVRVLIPAGAAGSEIHVVLAATDSGQPRLTRYRRAVITVDDSASAAQRLAPFQQPPEALAGRPGPERSPLVFADGSPVASSNDWPRRRREIRDAWERILGPWPPLLARPCMAVTNTLRRDNFVQQELELELAPGVTGPAILMIPDGATAQAPRPAVVVVYYEPRTSAGLNPAQSRRDFARQLARRGFVTLSLGTPGGDAWKPELGGAACQPLMFHAYIAANAWHTLASLPVVDAARIGITGHSYGGKWALFGAAFWDRYAAVAVSDPGIMFDETRPNVNYWEPWYLGAEPGRRRRPGLPTATNPATGAYAVLRREGRDLHEVHALLAPRPFLVSGGAEDPLDRWRALNHLVAVNELLGHRGRAALTTRPDHTPSDESNAVLFAFFQHFLGR